MALPKPIGSIAKLEIILLNVLVILTADKRFVVSSAFKTISFSCKIAVLPTSPQSPVYPPVSKEAAFLY